MRAPNKPLPTQERLHELFYCVNGNLIRKIPTPTVVVSVGDVAGTTNPQGYTTVRVDGGLFKLHRLVWKWYYGTDPEGLCDHWDRNPRNNNIWNLRDTSHRENNHNNTRTMDNHNGQLQTVTINGVNKRTPYGIAVQVERRRNSKKL